VEKQKQAVYERDSKLQQLAEKREVRRFESAQYYPY
jgi:hypothetical protein